MYTRLKMGVTNTPGALLDWRKAAGLSMAIEIERKFLVRNDDWRRVARTSFNIVQAYLSSGERSSTRVRIRDGKDATLTVKSKPAELRRVEIEYPITVSDAETLLRLRETSLIVKTRHIVPSGGDVWQVDVFGGENAGLVIAEIELSDAHDQFDQPPWLGVEVTGHRQYYNSALARQPFGRWAVPLTVPASMG
jgi:adenylate cyclase